MDKKVLFCHQCDELKETTLKLTAVTHNIKDELIVIEVEIPHCTECGAQLSDLDIEEKHFDLALNEYRKRKNLLFPEEIKLIRESYGLSQRAFARALGFAEPTINRYELGAIPDAVHNGILLLIKYPQNMEIIASQNKYNLSVKDFLAIQESIKKLKETNSVQEVKNLEKRVLEKQLQKLDQLDRKMNLVLKTVTSRENIPYDVDFEDPNVGYYPKIGVSPQPFDLPILS